jgi:hypothetical protein
MSFNLLNFGNFKKNKKGRGKKQPNALSLSSFY